MTVVLFIVLEHRIPVDLLAVGACIHQMRMLLALLHAFALPLLHNRIVQDVQLAHFPLDPHPLLLSGPFFAAVMLLSFYLLAFAFVIFFVVVFLVIIEVEEVLAEKLDAELVFEGLFGE